MSEAATALSVMRSLCTPIEPVTSGSPATRALRERIHQLGMTTTVRTGWNGLRPSLLWRNVAFFELTPTLFMRRLADVGLRLKKAQAPRPFIFLGDRALLESNTARDVLWGAKWPLLLVQEEKVYEMRLSPVGLRKQWEYVLLDDTALEYLIHLALITPCQ